MPPLQVWVLCLTKQRTPKRSQLTNPVGVAAFNNKLDHLSACIT
ncbi:MAG TPA: hypothetical protein V6D14_24430 [Coleofasciculaceae cyanobacterium]